VQDLDRDGSAVPKVLSEEDRRHAAVTELALDAVAVDDRSCKVGGGLAHRRPGGRIARSAYWCMAVAYRVQDEVPHDRAPESELALDPARSAYFLPVHDARTPSRGVDEELDPVRVWDADGKRVR